MVNIKNLPLKIGEIQEFKTQPKTQGLDSSLARAIVETKILPALIGLFPNVSHATKNDDLAELWIGGWALQIMTNHLTEAEIDHGIAGVVKVVMRHGNPPLSFSHFLEACRPDDLRAADLKARKSNFPTFLLQQDLLKNEGWLSARDRALSKIRKNCPEILS